MSTELKNKIKNILDSKVFKGFIYGVGVFLIATIIFQAGVFTGYRRASFGHDFSNNYERNFGFERGPRMMDDVLRNDLPNAHGAIGKIIKKDTSSIVVMDGKDNTEKVVSINSDTEIREGRNIITLDDLKMDDFVVVIGNPNQNGQIDAKLIRVLPDPMSNQVNTSNQ